MAGKATRKLASVSIPLDLGKKSRDDLQHRQKDGKEDDREYQVKFPVPFVMSP